MGIGLGYGNRVIDKWIARMIAGQANRVENSDGASHLSVPSLDAELPVPAEVFLALSTAAITVSWKASTRQSQWLKNRLLKRVLLLSSVVDSSKLNHDARQSTAEIGNSLAVVWQCQLRQNCRQSVSMTSCSQMLRLASPHRAIRRARRNRTDIGTFTAKGKAFPDMKADIALTSIRRRPHRDLRALRRA